MGDKTRTLAAEVSLILDFWISRRYISNCGAKTSTSKPFTSTQPIQLSHAICDGTVGAHSQNQDYVVSCRVSTSYFLTALSAFFTYFTLFEPPRFAKPCTNRSTYSIAFAYLLPAGNSILFSLKTAKISFQKKRRKYSIVDPLSPRRLIYLTWLSL